MTETIAFIDGPMIIRFIENQDAFNKCADERFNAMKENQNEIDIDCERFRSEMRALMVAVAEGIGKSAVNVLVDEGSLMMKVYAVETERINGEERRKEIEMMKKFSDEVKNREIVNPNKKMINKKKRSIKFLSFCGCSGKYLPDN